MKKRLAVCVPYRDRKAHLDIFMPYLTEFLSRRKIEHKIFVCNQTDDKLFNRGMLKNIAFKEACKEGFDYFAFHDVDLLPADDSCDYRYPDKYPIHLCVLKSDDDYRLSYRQYFGGCVLFTKEQFEKVNGYYNGYWGWGYEDDDLFYRVTQKGLANIGFMQHEILNRKVVSFHGKKSYIEVIKKSVDKTIDKNGFSLFMFMKPEADNHRNYLIGTNYDFFEVPFCFAGLRDILSYNKYEYFTVKLYNKLRRSNVLYSKQPKNEWVMLFLTVDAVKKKIKLFINGVGENKFSQDVLQLSYKTPLLDMENKKIILGNKRRFFFPNNLPFNGQIAEVCLWSKVFTETDVQKKLRNINENLYKDKIVFHYDFKNIKDNVAIDNGLHKNNARLHNCSIEKIAKIKIRTHTEPYRRIGKYICLPHNNEGIVRKRVFQKYCIKLKKGASYNEKIFRVYVQGNRINPDHNGLNSLSYKIKNKHILFGSHTMIDVEC